MNSPRPKYLAVLLALLLVGPGLFGAVPPAATAVPKAPALEPSAAPAKKEPGSTWVFSILPKSMQQNPLLEITVITEMTPAGKRLPPVSPAQPAYYETFSSGFRQLGDAPANEVTLKQEDIDKLLTRSLATNGYQPAERPGKPPTLLIVYMWGSHSRIEQPPTDPPAISAEEIARNVLDRASLVGGEKFASDLLTLFEQAGAQETAAAARVAPGGEQIMTPEMMAFSNPVEMFRRASIKNEFILDQTSDNLYYVVASAYDYASAATRQKTLLWRTRMTVAAQGVSQEQTLPTLVLSAAPYFGKDMPEVETLSKRPIRDGSVEIGTPVVVPPEKK